VPTKYSSSVNHLSVKENQGNPLLNYFSSISKWGSLLCKWKSNASQNLILPGRCSFHVFSNSKSNLVSTLQPLLFFTSIPHFTIFYSLHLHYTWLRLLLLWPFLWCGNCLLLYTSLPSNFTALSGYWPIFYYILFFAELVVKPRALYLPGRHSNTEINS
jgi:hypothetical protein